MRKPTVVLCAAVVLLAAPPLQPAGAAQEFPGVPAMRHTAMRALSLDEAIAIALKASEDVRIAGAQVVRADAARDQATSARWPQLYGSAAYTRTLRSQFQGLSEDPADETPAAPPTCEPFSPNPSLPLEQRVRALEQAVDCQNVTGGFGAIVDRLPFGRENQWSFGLSLSTPLYTGGRISAQIDAATAVRERTAINLDSTQAALTLDVARAYFDALLADQFVEIAAATIAQAEDTLEQTVAMRRVGTRPEFDVLRARVALETLRPSLIQQQAARTLAYMRLKQLVDVPLETDLTLTTALDEPAGTSIAPVRLEEAIEPAQRAPVREAARTLAAERDTVRATRAQRLPDVSLTAQVQQLAYPSTLVPTGDFFSNWTVGVSASVPIFTAGRIGAAIAAARAAAEQAELRLAQVRELAALDTADALLALDTAQATWRASVGTVTEAGETVRIAEIRFREGLSTQIELSDAQLLLQQARANRARAERELRIARLRLALIDRLPLTVPGAAQQPALPTPPRPSAPSQSIPGQAPGTLRASDPLSAATLPMIPGGVR